MPSIVRGQVGPVYAGPDKEFIPGVGWTSEHIYQFSNSADANAFADALSASNTNRVRLEDRAPDYRVRVFAANADGGAGGDDAVDIYELPPLDIEKDVVESPFFQSLSADTQSLLRAYRADSSDANYEAAEIELAADANGLAMLRLIRAGTVNYYAPSVEFRWTRIVSDNGLPTAASGAYSGVGSVFTTAGLTGAIGGLPAVWATAIINAAAAYPAPVTGYSKGWLKQQSNIVRRGTNRNELTLRWILGNWSDDLY